MSTIYWSRIALIALVLHSIGGRAAESSAESNNDNGAQADAQGDQYIESLLSLPIEALMALPIEAATKSTESSALSPAIVTVISQDDIHRYGYQSIAEVLSHVNGFVDNDDLAIHNFGVRGINAGVRAGSRPIKFMIDGQETAFRPGAQHFIGAEFIPMSLVQRIEVMRGPASALYGANAFLAVVNVVTKKAETLKEQGSAVALNYDVIEAAGDGYQLSLVHGDQWQDWDYSFGLSIGKHDRQGIELPRRSPEYLHQANQQSIRDDNQPMSFYGRVDHALNKRMGLSGKLHYQQLNVDNAFADINALESAGPTRIGLNNGFGRLDFDWQVNDSIDFNSFLTYSKGGTLGDDQVELGADNFYLDRRIGYESIDFGVHVRLALTENSDLLVGVDATRDHQALETFSRVDRHSGERTKLTPSQNRLFSNEAVYFQYIQQLSTDIKALFGYRIDNNSEVGEQGSLRAGVVAQLPLDVVLKVLIGSSFQTPSAQLLYRKSVQSGDIIGNPNLDVQKAHTQEVSIAAPINRYSHLSLTYFHTKVDDLVVFESDFTNLIAKNRQSSDSDGIEFEGRFIYGGFDGYLNYSRNNTRQSVNDNNLAILEQREAGELFPKQTANLGLSYDLGGVNVSWQTRWTDKRPASTQNVIAANQFYDLKATIQSDIAINFELLSLVAEKPANLRFKVLDVFDHQRVNPGFGGIDFPSLGRRYLFIFEQHF